MGREFWDKLDPVIADAKWFNAKSLEKLPFYPLNKKGKLLFPALALETFYALFLNFRVLSVQTRARRHITSRNKPDFEAVYSYYSDKYGTKQTSHKLWGANDGALLRRELCAGIDTNMSMLRRELLDDPANRRAETGRQIKIKMRDPKTRKRLYLNGRVIEESASRILLRARSGNLISLSKGLRE